MTIHAPFAERFWAKVDRPTPDSCWLWTAGVNNTGYGRVYDNARGGPVLAHRAAWELTQGPIPDGLHALHHCDVPACVNPRHLYLGTDADNQRDCHTRGRARRALALDNGRAKLSDEDVLAIHSLAAEGLMRVEIAQRFGVNSAHVSRILSGQRRALAYRAAQKEIGE